jgi:hypothetical protein
MSTTDDYKTAATAAYNSLKTAYTTGAFWRCGNALDTILDYYLHVDKSDAANFADAALAQFTPPGDAWYDDFGWWAVATLKAVRSKLYDGTPALEQFQRTLQTSWTGMIGAPFAWQNSNQQTYADYAPLIDGGVWNCVLSDPNYPGGNSANGGRQNTVTNGLYLTFTTRIARHPPIYAPTARVASDCEYGFLKSWFTAAPAGKLLLYQYNSSSPNVVVRERVGAFQNTATTDPYYVPGLAWAGDQGIMLGGLIARMQLLGSGDPEYGYLNDTATHMLAGAKDYLTGIMGMPPGVLAPWSAGGPPGNDPTDYWTGIGVYMRYLLSVFEFEPLKPIIQQMDYQSFLAANADYVVDGPTNQSDNDLVNYTNDLARLVAAIVCLEPNALR